MRVSVEHHCLVLMALELALILTALREVSTAVANRGLSRGITSLPPPVARGINTQEFQMQASLKVRSRSITSRASLARPCQRRLPPKGFLLGALPVTVRTVLSEFLGPCLSPCPSL